jgi:NADPH-dependent 2,4-dienoyl-CoA reductase/sulfur reductase-like enzyme
VSADTQPLSGHTQFLHRHRRLAGARETGSGFARSLAMTEHVPVVVIVGGVFAGLAAAKALRRAPVRIVLIDRSNHHVFQPLLYQVAICALATGQIAAPIREILGRQPNTTVLDGRGGWRRQGEEAGLRQ